MDLHTFMFSLFAFLWGIALSEITASTAGEKNGVVAVLSATNFSSYIRENSQVLVEFYAPWCGHCKELEPIYNKAAKLLAKKKIKAKLAKVDTTNEISLGKLYEIKGYPTLLYFEKGKKSSDYSGPREADGIVDWLLRRSSNSVKQFGSEKEAREWALKEQKYQVLLAFVAKDSAEIKTIRKLAKELIDESEEFAIVNIAPGDNQKVVYLKDIESPSSPFRSSDDIAEETCIEPVCRLKKDSLLKWIQVVRYPAIADTTFSPGMYLVSSLQFNTAIVLAEREKRNSIREALRPFLKQHHRKLFFSFALPTDLSAMELGFKKDGSTQMILLDRSNAKDRPAKKYKFNGPFEDEERLKEFFTNYASSDLPTFMKSEAIPTKQDLYEPVDVVADSFENVVLDPKKDVFVEYYAPWCAHCKSLLPAWTELAKVVHTKYPGITIAKMDATANDAENVKGYPTLILYPAGKNKHQRAINYDGGRTLEELIDFVEGNAETLEEEDSNRDEL